MSYLEDSTVIIADDDPDIRVIVSSAIQAMGCDVIEAENGSLALSLYRECSPDLVLLDIMMPEVDGTEVCRQIRAQDGGVVPIIMLTARDGLDDKVAALDDGADDYITKPFVVEELQARVRAMLRIRELNLNLQKKNDQLKQLQDKIVEQERQMVVGQLAGTAAHKLGQPLSAILLNCHLLRKLAKDDEMYERALSGVESDVRRMTELIEGLKKADASSTEDYYGEESILNLKE